MRLRSLRTKHNRNCSWRWWWWRWWWHSQWTCSWRISSDTWRSPSAAEVRERCTRRSPLVSALAAGVRLDAATLCRCRRRASRSSSTSTTLSPFPRIAAQQCPMSAVLASPPGCPTSRSSPSATCCPVSTDCPVSPASTLDVAVTPVWTSESAVGDPS